jgi:4-carboxymuconolactone decarboxylase
MARLPYVDPATAPERVREALERLPVPLNIFRMVAHAETAFPEFMRLGGAILGRLELAPRLRELVILRVAKLSPSIYEWTQHVPIGKATGVTDEQIAALEKGDVSASCFDETDRLVLRFVDETVREVKVSDATFAKAAARFSPREVVELVLTVGFYMMVARLLESTAVDVDPPAGTAIPDSIRRALKGS